MQSAAPVTQHDIVVCGGGLVGASLALATAELRLDTALVEAASFESSAAAGAAPSFDERTTAISNGTQRIFAALGIWPLIEHAATPIKRIHVSDQGRFGFARIEAHEQDLPQLGYVVINRVMGAALVRRLRESGVHLYVPSRVAATTVDAERRIVKVESAAGSTAARDIAARLVIAADGANSLVRDAAGVGTTRKDYDQTAIIAHVATQKFHDYTAYERFTPGGPLAMLPLSDGRVGAVWVLAPSEADATLQLDDAAFIARLEAAFGLRLGRVLQVGKRFAYPLSLTQADAHSAPRLAVTGNAAQSLHPIAGQGFNLGLRDAACLAEILADAQRNDAAFDPGGPDVLARYAEWRSQDRQGIVRFTDGLVSLFAKQWGPMKFLRDAGMLLFDLSPSAKGYLAQLSLGAAGKIPRMARGGALRE